MLALFTTSTQAQVKESTVFDVDLRFVPLDEALAEFSAMTGAGMTYDPRITKGHTVYCVLNNAEINEVLSCFLEATNLTFARLESGTFLVMQQSNVPLQQGHLSGLVTDLSTGTPLVQAHVLLASNTLDIGTITNSQGQFTLPPLLPGRYLMQTSYLGYTSTIDTLDIVPGQRSFHQVELKGTPVSVTPIIIDGLHLQKPSEQLKRTILLRSSAPEHYLENTFTGQFKAITGVRMNDITADAHLQGSNSGEHQFRIDGIPVFLPQQTIGILGPFSPFAIHSLTIHKSGFGVQEGSHLAGVIEAHQFIESESTLDAQLDLNAINSRLSWQQEWDTYKSISLMAATRFSLWSFLSQPPLQNMLNQWVRPDPFLIFAPTQEISSIDFSFLQDALNISPIPITELSFSDIHFAGQYKANPYSGIKSSLYYGSNDFAGTLISPDIFQPTNLGSPRVGPANGGDGKESTFQPLLSVIDNYSWYNLAGQIRYYTLLGNNTLFNLQAKGSTYSLDQIYLQVDSLEYILGDVPEVDFSTTPLEELEFPTSEIIDTNATSEYSLDAQVDLTRGRHDLTIGLIATVSSTELDVLVTSLPSLQVAQDDVALPPEAEVLVTDKARIGYGSTVFRQSLFIQDRYSFTEKTTVQAGARLTFLPDRKAVYAEPRVSLRFDLPSGSNQTISLQTAVGLYRQYMLQLDVSTLNAGALFPSKRIWIPVNRDIRPPLAYHLSQSLLFTASSSLTFQLEGYLKYQQRLWFLSYISGDDLRTTTSTDTVINDLNDVLSPGEGITNGISLSSHWKSSSFSAALVYDYTSVRRRSSDLFLNNWFSAPWEEPHRLTANIDWNHKRQLWLSARFTGIWNRSWGYRQAYYDFFGHTGSNDFVSQFNFSNPDEHILPAYYQVDLGGAYNIELNRAHIQIRVDLLNAFDTQNVADWRIISRDGSLEKENRYYYPRIPSVALRLSW